MAKRVIWSSNANRILQKSLNSILKKMSLNINFNYK
jgi:hypothetical protein